jgi:hypothetical protein
MCQPYSPGEPLASPLTPTKTASGSGDAPVAGGGAAAASRPPLPPSGLARRASATASHVHSATGYSFSDVGYVRGLRASGGETVLSAALGGAPGGAAAAGAGDASVGAAAFGLSLRQRYGPLRTHAGASGAAGPPPVPPRSPASGSFGGGSPGSVLAAAGGGSFGGATPWGQGAAADGPGASLQSALRKASAAGCDLYDTALASLRGARL